MSKKICKAQNAALSNGETLEIDEGFRPSAVQNQIYKEISKIIKDNPTLKNNFGDRDISAFIENGISDRQIGYSIDMSLYKITKTEYKSTGKYKFMQNKGTSYKMPSNIQDLSISSIVYASPDGGALSEGMKNSEPALKLQKYCMDAGLSPSALEWWHFSDEETRKNLTKTGDGKYQVTKCLSKSPD